MKTKNLFFIVLLLTFAFRLWQTTGCQKFRNFRLDPTIVITHVESQILLDDSQRGVKRIFHNKVTSSIFIFTKSYATLFTPKLITQIVGPLGLLLIVIAVNRIIQAKNILGLIHFGLILILPILLIFSDTIKLLLIPFMLSLFSFTFWSISYFFESKIKTVTFLSLVPLTLLYFFYSWRLETFCSEVIFK